MDLRSVQRRCQAALQAVDLPDPFDVADFARNVSRRRGRRLTLVPKHTALGPCGLWVALPDVDYVFFEPRTTPVHRNHILLHELGHLIRDHEPRERIRTDVLRELFCDLDIEVVQRVLGRSSYSAWEEQEAEMIASLVSERVHQRRIPTSPVGSDQALVDRLWSTLGTQRASPRHG